MPASCKEEIILFLNPKCTDSEVVWDLKAAEWLEKCFGSLGLCWNHTCDFCTPCHAEKYSKVLTKEHSFIFLCSRLYMLLNFILFLLWAVLVWVRTKFMPDGKVTLILLCCLLCNAASVRYGDKLLVTVILYYYYPIAINTANYFFSLFFFFYFCMKTQYSFFEHLLKERTCPCNRQNET